MGFRNALTSIYSRYQLPVFPVENGLGWREEMTGNQMIQDDYRIQYHRDHIDAMKQAMIEDGTDVIVPFTLIELMKRNVICAVQRKRRLSTCVTYLSLMVSTVN
ncbi:6-phospho-beta-glucosidase [Leuconostoc pseudomesenteroides PS12]|nr:6-phospho-beta-glucosidase [Leuconostoc pseudomesenteroides 1159]KDA50103.1 6-phospho-beta-glucosidase [Leuconostoc pseudomesenteroides PS12]OQJ68526.1 hypothetical protein BMS78_05220 [Leuconostoc pseudomesenteroides]CCJ65694.1 6-phospho-beta-glucosidase [Leuconostoc pseudomesenteroides 4882]